MRGQIFTRTPQPQAPAAEPADGASETEAPAPKKEVEVKAAAPELRQRPQYRESKASLPGEEEQRKAASARQGAPQPTMPMKAAPKVGRNDPCPCGSGKKYKNCHGKGL